MILSIDPSGNFHEGKGTTGLCLFDEKKMKPKQFASISAKAFKTQEVYWDAVIKIIWDIVDRHPDCVVLIEDYFLYSNRAASQINSKLETPRLIGALQYDLYRKAKIIPVFQPASLVKSRWADHILKHKGYAINKIDRHCKDALRHAVHYATFKIKEKAVGE